MAGDRGIRAGSSGGSLTGGIAGSGGGIGLGSGNVGPTIASARMRETCKRSSDKMPRRRRPSQGMTRPEGPLFYANVKIREVGSCLGCLTYLLLWPNVVFGMRHSHQIFVEPSDDVIETFDAMPGLAGTREFVSLAREDDHRGRALQIFEGAE